MTKNLFVVAALSLLPGSVAVAAPKPPAPTTFAPEVIYRYNGRNSVDLRLSNATGTAAVLLHRSASISGSDLAPASKRTATFVENSSTSARLMIRSWTIDGNGAITIGAPRVLHEARSIIYPDFSPAGDKIAFTSWDEIGNIHSIKTVDVATGIATTVVAGIEGPAYLRWSTNGDTLYYARQITEAGISAWNAYRQPIDGSAHTLMFSERSIEAWDISRDGTERLVLPFWRPEFGSTIKTGTWDGTSVSLLSVPQGSQPHYSCGNDRLIYRSVNRSSPGPVKIFNFATGTDIVFSKDQNIPNADFFPCG